MENCSMSVLVYQKIKNKVPKANILNIYIKNYIFWNRIVPMPFDSSQISLG